MRTVRLPLLILLLCLTSVAMSSAQEVTVSVGAVTKYSGIASNEKDLKDLKHINDFLNTIEAQFAKEFINHSEVEYLDRMNTEAIFRELHLSSNANFDASSGALHGLLGRLDFLIVIDSATPSTARVRLLDVQSGAVKAIESCTQKSSILGLASQGPSDCIAPFLTHSIAVMHSKKATKEDKARQQAAARATAQKQAALAQRRVQEQAAKVAKEQAKAAQEAKLAAEQEAAAQMKITERLSAIKPHLDDALARFSAQNDFWHDLAQQLASSGLSLKPTISSALRATNHDASRCRQFYGNP